MGEKKIGSTTGISLKTFLPFRINVNILPLFFFFMVNSKKNLFIFQEHQHLKEWKTRRIYGSMLENRPPPNKKVWRTFHIFELAAHINGAFIHWGPSTALSGKLKWQKNIQSISRLLWERPHPGLWNEPPLDSLDPQSLNPFMASLWIGSGEGLAIKGFGDWGSRLSSGGSFRSPEWGRSRSSLEIDWIFFRHFNFPESAVLWMAQRIWTK